MTPADPISQLETTERNERQRGREECLERQIWWHRLPPPGKFNEMPSWQRLTWVRWHEEIQWHRGMTCRQRGMILTMNRDSTIVHQSVTQKCRRQNISNIYVYIVNHLLKEYNIYKLYNNYGAIQIKIFYLRTVPQKNASIVFFGFYQAFHIPRWYNLIKWFQRYHQYAFRGDSENTGTW